MSSKQDRRTFVSMLAAMAAVGPGTRLSAGEASVPTGSWPGPGPASGPDGGSAPPDLDAGTLEEAERLAGISFTPTEREQILRTIAEQRAMIARRLELGPLPNELPPAEVFRAQLPGVPLARATGTGDPSDDLPDPGPCPDEDLELAYAPVWRLGQWLKRGAITSLGLTELSIRRLKEADPRLKCVVSLTEERALAQARRADEEIRSGRWRGPLHGIPWGAKDIIDVAETATTWGAGPFRERMSGGTAEVVRRLDESGAVLVAKLAVGALAYGDIWYGGTCRNPFDTEQGSSGSSAGSAAATAAGLVPFSLGSETLGSIVSPCDRCGATGLRPTFGRVSRNGVMALCWSMDKIGPITRSVLDSALVLDAINGASPGDPCSVDEPFYFDAGQTPRGLRVGYDPSWFADGNRALRVLREAGTELVPIELPAIETAPLMVPLFAESAAAFEELTRSGRDDELEWQADAAWPNTFRQSWFIPAIELIQASRVRRQVMRTMESFMNDRFDAIIAPPFTDLLVVTNSTGHPTLVMRSGFSEQGRPESITLVGRLFDEGTLCRLGGALERGLAVNGRRPEGFA